jgi:hypothetical protein
VGSFLLIGFPIDSAIFGLPVVLAIEIHNDRPDEFLGAL